MYYLATLRSAILFTSTKWNKYIFICILLIEIYNPVQTENSNNLRLGDFDSTDNLTKMYYLALS